jgi:F-type H+-transporting ATPase subunit b
MPTPARSLVARIGACAVGGILADAAPAIAAEGEAGMPQLDPAAVSPQLIWLVITFIALLVLMSRVALPRVAAVIEQRDARIKGDLDRAERVKIEADAAAAAYQKTMADARAKAQAELRQGQAAIAAETSARDAEFARKLALRTKAAEDVIAQAKTRALADLRNIGADVAASVVGRVAGLSLPADRVLGAVDAAMTER